MDCQYYTKHYVSLPLGLKTLSYHSNVSILAWPYALCELEFGYFYSHSPTYIPPNVSKITIHKSLLGHIPSSYTGKIELNNN